MAKGTYFQRGESLDYLNSGETAIEVGDIVAVGSRIGIAGDNIAVGAVGSVHVEGVFSIPKTSGAISVGADVSWSSSGAAAASAGDTVIGYAVAAAASTDTSVLVKLGGGYAIAAAAESNPE